MHLHCVVRLISVFLFMLLLKVYGKKQIVMEKNEVDEIKKFDDPGLELMGFKPMDRLKLHHHIRPALFIYPEEEQISGLPFVHVLIEYYKHCLVSQSVYFLTCLDLFGLQ